MGNRNNIRDSWQSSLKALFLLLLTVGLAISSQAQGIHTTLRAHVNPYSFTQSYAGVWGDGNFAYIGSEHRSGILIYDITNPGVPVLASYYNPSNSVDMEDIKVANGIGYFASNFGDGLHIVDVSNPYNPQLISTITSANGGFDSVHKIAIWQNYVFIPQNQASPAIVKIFDVTNPAIPVLKTTITSTDPQWVNDLDIQETSGGAVRLYTAGWGGKGDIWDITNIATEAPVLLGSFNGGIDGSSASATADGNFLAYTTKNPNGTSFLTIYNINDPANVTVASTITMPALGIDAVCPHDPHIVGNLMYVSWFQAGTLIFDITDPTHPILVGSYDTWPGQVWPTDLDGNWGVYPYLGQDRVLLSDRNTGLYVINATGVSSQPALYNFKLNPASVVGSLPSTATAYLVGVAPSGGTAVNVSSSNSLAIVPATATVPEGGTSASVTVTTAGVSIKSTATLNASYNGSTRSTVLTITPEIPSSLKFSPGSGIGGFITTGMVTMAAPTPTDTTVNLAVVSGGAGVNSIPSSVTVAAGNSSATFAVSTNSVAASTVVKISAAANGTTVSNTFTVTPNTPTSLTLTPSSLYGGASSVGKVTFAQPVTGETTVTLTVLSGAAAISSMPATVTVPAGNNSATWNIVTNPVSATTAVQVSASANGGTKSATLTVKPNVPTGFTFTPTSITGGGNSVGKVTFGQAVASDTTVTLSVISGTGAVASMPASITVSAGTATGSFTLTTASVSQLTTVQISATANGGSKTASLSVTANAPTSVSLSTASLIGGASTSAKVTFGQPVVSDTTVTLAIISGASAVASMPATITVPAGSSSGSWTVVTAPVASATTVQISASANGVSKTATLTVKPSTPSGFTFTPGSVTGGSNSTGKVTFSQPVAIDTTVTLTVVTGSAAVPAVPSSFIAPAGSTSAVFTLTTAAVTQATTVQISAAANGISKTATLTVH